MHTQTDWVSCPGNAREFYGIECKGDNNDLMPIARCTGPDRKANAQRIVDCVNGCEGINPAAVKDLLAALTRWTEWAVNRDIPFELISETRAAIAKAVQKC